MNDSTLGGALRKTMALAMPGGIARELESAPGFTETPIEPISARESFADLGTSVAMYAGLVSLTYSSGTRVEHPVEHLLAVGSGLLMTWGYDRREKLIKEVLNVERQRMPSIEPGDNISAIYQHIR